MTNTYKLIMDSKHNPLSHIPDTNTRHMVMQVLAWMWCIIFSMYLGSIVAFGIVLHYMLWLLLVCLLQWVYLKQPSTDHSISVV